MEGDSPPCRSEKRFKLNQDRATQSSGRTKASYHHARANGSSRATVRARGRRQVSSATVSSHQAPSYVGGDPISDVDEEALECVSCTIAVLV